MSIVIAYAPAAQNRFFSAPLTRGFTIAANCIALGTMVAPLFWTLFCEILWNVSRSPAFPDSYFMFFNNAPVDVMLSMSVAGLAMAACGAVARPGALSKWSVLGIVVNFSAVCALAMNYPE